MKRSLRWFYAVCVFTNITLFFSTTISAQAILTNNSPLVLIDFSANTPSSVGTNPQSVFAGTGFEPNPTAQGRLNSNAWATTGWSDGTLAFGGTSTTGDHARGAFGTARITAGIHAYTGAPGSTANPSLLIQPGGSDFAPGTLTLRIQNQGSTTITSLSVSYNLYVRNDQGRSSSFNFSHSADNSTYTPVGALDYTSPVAADASPSWVLVSTAPSRSTTINGLNIAPNDYYYIRWSSADVAGSGTRDELGLDDISINATFTQPVYYPRTSATDLSQASQWTTDPAGVTGTSPTNFTSPNQVFNLNGNVAMPTVSNPWTFSNGSNLILNNIAPLVFTPTSTLIIGSGSIADFNSKPVTLKSAASGTAAIGNTTGAINGATNVTVERYITSLNNRAFRLLAPSVNTTTTIRANWQEGGATPAGYGTHITGSTTGANGFDATQTGNPSLYLYTANPPAWQAVANTDATNLSATTGYLTFIRGDRTIDLNSTASPLPTNNTVLRATGTLLTGTQTFGLASATGFSLITNPYASAVNWAAIENVNTGIEQYYTFWDPNIGVRGGYVTVNANGNVSPATSAGTITIPSGMAFFVKGSGSGTPSVEIREAHKTTTSVGDVFRSGTQTETFSASLFYTNTQGQRITADGVLAVYNNDYTVGYDEADATQIANWDEDVAISRSGQGLSIESRPLIDAADTIHLSVARLKVQNYEWQFEATAFNHPGLQAVLLDSFQNTRTPLSLTGQTIVPFSVTTNSASSVTGRFAVVFENIAVLPVRLTTITAQQKGKDVLVQWVSASDAEVREYQVEKSVDGRTFLKMATVASRAVAGVSGYEWLDAQPIAGKHFYRTKAIGLNGSVHYSPVVAIDLSGKATPVTVYPNPLSGTEVGLSLNLPAHTYTIQLVNTAGQTVHRQQLVHTGGAVAQTISLPSGIASGIYQLTVSSAQSTYTQRLIKH